MPTVQVQCVQKLHVQDHNTVIGRWSLPWNLLSKQAFQEAKLTKTCQCSRVTGELSNVQWIVLTAIVDSLCCWTVSEYGNTLRPRATAAHVHMTRLLWSKFIRHCFGVFYVIKKPSGLQRGPRFAWDSTEPFSLLSHVETSKIVSNYYVQCMYM